MVKVLDNLFVKFYFDPLPYASGWCMLPTHETETIGGLMDELKKYPNDELIAIYLCLRKRREDAKKAFNESQAKTLALMGSVENEFLSRMHTTGTNSFNTDDGTAYKSTETSVTVKDWPEFLKFVLENKSFDLLGRYAAKTNVASFMEENQAIPPGLAVSRREVCNFRSPRKVTD